MTKEEGIKKRMQKRFDDQLGNWNLKTEREIPSQIPFKQLHVKRIYISPQINTVRGIWLKEHNVCACYYIKSYIRKQINKS